MGEIESASFGTVRSYMRARFSGRLGRGRDEINEKRVRRNGKMHLCVVEGQMTFLLIVEVQNCIFPRNARTFGRRKIARS